jgi:hypothetical protein
LGSTVSGFCLVGVILGSTVPVKFQNEQQKTFTFAKKKLKPQSREKNEDRPKEEGKSTAGKTAKDSTLRPYLNNL